MTTATLSGKWTIEAETLDWAQECKVDRETGIISNVLLCGNVSQNGYNIPAKAFGGNSEGVKRLYEGKLVCSNHLPIDQLDTPLNRPVEDVAGVIRNSRMAGGRPFGDIHTKGCMKSEMLMSLAEAQVPSVGMSHVAEYKFNEEQTDVEQVMEIGTVDVVLNPATTRTFSEKNYGESTMAETQAYREQIESLKQEKTTLASERESLKSELAETKKAVESLNTAKAALESEVKTLKSEKEELTKKVESHEAKEAVQQRRSKIAEAFKKHDLKIDDSVHCSEAFLNQLLAVEDDSAREALIKERAELIKEAGKGSGSFNGSQERKSKGSDFDAKEWFQS